MTHKMHSTGQKWDRRTQKTAHFGLQMGESSESGEIH